MQGMTPGARQQHLLEREKQEREALARYQREAPRRAAARRTMAFWNAALAGGWRSMFWPTVGAALRAECNFLHVLCPACQQLGEIDLRTIDIHPNATLSTVVRRLSCQRCCPHPPFARPLGATRRSWLDERKWCWRPTPPPNVTPAPRNTGRGWAQNRIASRRASD